MKDTSIHIQNICAWNPHPNQKQFLELEVARTGEFRPLFLVETSRETCFFLGRHGPEDCVTILESFVTVTTRYYKP